MKVFMRMILPEESIWKEDSSLLYALGIKESTAPIISVVGAGGKTSTIEYLAKEYGIMKKQVIVTTTTHMYRPHISKWCCKESMELIDQYLEKQMEVWVGLPSGEDKMTSPSLSFLEQLMKKKIPILIEADGAKRLPFKVPGEHEPVLFQKSNIVIGVLGLDALGVPLKEVCFRSSLAAKLLDKLEASMITEEDYVKVASSNYGLKKDVSSEMEYVVILNKADNKETVSKACRIRSMLKEQNIRNVIITSYDKR